MERPKRFNRAIVFGSVLKNPVKKETKSRSAYASIQLQCPNDLYGDVRVWGKIWGEAGKDALEDLKQGDLIRLEGVFQQYESEKSGLVSNFNFFNYRFCVGREKQDLRAIFILVADVIQVESQSAGKTIKVEYLKQEEGSYPYPPETYQLFVSKKDSLFEAMEGEMVGKRVKFKGVLENEVDEFCETTPTKAVIKQAEVVWVPEQGNKEAPF